MESKLFFLFFIEISKIDSSSRKYYYCGQTKNKFCEEGGRDDKGILTTPNK